MSAGGWHVRGLAAELGLRRTGREWRGRCFHCGYADAFVLAEGKHGPVGWCASCRDREAIARILRGPHTAVASGPRETDARNVQRRLERARQIWQGSEPVTGSPAARYLDSRGIGHLAAGEDLRFRADCPHPTGTLDRPVWLPALIAAVRDMDGRLVGVHRTFLKRDGFGKAEIEPQKASLGPICGGAVRLAPLGAVFAVGELVIGEGIESSASADLLLRIPAWAAISAGNLAHGLVLPDAIRKIVIAADRDAKDQHGRHPGQDAARDAWFRLRREGRAVRIAMPDEGCGDFNDLLLAKRAAQ
jgi:phage/plasmid primase-like uncharacterized protein